MSEVGEELRQRIWAFKELGHFSGWSKANIDVWGCPLCGAVVFDRFSHDGWHEKAKS